MNEFKTCSRCKKTLPLSEFHNKKSGKDGKQSACKKCNIKHAKLWNDTKKETDGKYWIERDKRARAEGSARKRRARLYGITPEELDSLLDEAGGLCSICQEPPVRWLVIDHCHNTGKVRGVLCEKCNQGLGLFRDNPEFLRNAIDYLNRAG